MFGLIVLSLVTVGLAAPQYNYQQGSSILNGLQAGSKQVGNAGGYGAQSVGSFQIGQPSAGSFQIGQPSAGSFQIGQPSAGSFQIGQPPAGSFQIGQPSAGSFQIAQPSVGNLQQSQPTQTIYNKQFFIHSAPEDNISGDSLNQIDNLSLRRNLRVVFIKAPENKGLENAALQLAKTASEDQTAIYVLNKQTDLNELQNKLSQIQDVTATRPEVHFVKYKTPQEAEHAQHSIQAQYDQLGGSSQVSNEGVAPVQSFIGALGNQGSFTAASNDRPAAATAGSVAAYLPPQFKL